MFFTIVFSNNHKIFLASDLTRSFPIFYTVNNNQYYFSDDIFHIKQQFKIKEFDSISETELILSNHTHGKKTLLKNVYQVQPSEFLILKNNTIIEQNFFFSYSTTKELSISYQSLFTNAVEAIENSFKRFIESLNNRTVVIPLSGGFDSRLITVLLKKHNYKNVVCFTYGRKDSFEIENSKKTADTLNFKWHFIEYTDKLIVNFIETKELKSYAHFAGKLSSNPNLQEYFAVKYLKENALIPDNAVFVPGYAGDILGGSEYLTTIPNTIKSKELPTLILHKKLSSGKNAKHLTTEIEKNLQVLDNEYATKIPETVFDDYNIKERIAKYIFNSASFYSYFGYEFRFPFWDKELLTFFKEVPIKHKKLKQLYDDVLINEYFKKFDVYFNSEIQPTRKSIISQQIKDKVKPILPTFIKQNLLKKNDWNNYYPITNQMVSYLETEGQSS